MSTAILEGLALSCRPLGEYDRLLTLLSEEEVVSAVLEQVLDVLGCRAGFVVLPTAAGDELRLVGARGYSDEIVSRWRRIPLDARIPAAATFREGRTVSVADVAELRKRLDAEKAEFHVVKNSSLRVAAKALGLPEFESALTGPTAVVVGGKNSAGVAKVLKKFFEDKQKLEVKVGVLEKKIVSAADLAKIADLPSFEALRSQLLGLLTQNAAAFVRVLDAKVKKEQPAAPAA